MEVEGEKGSDGARVRYSSPLAPFVLVLLIQRAASSDLLPRGIAGSWIPPFHLPACHQLWGEKHDICLSQCSPFFPPGHRGTGCGVALHWGQAVGRWKRCPLSVPLSLCIPALCWQLSPGEGQRPAPDWWIVICT